MVTPYVLKDSPNLLSIGKRTEKFGWGVQWKPRERGCHVTLPNGKHLFLHNEGFIPMVNSDKDNVPSGALSENTADTATRVTEASVPAINDSSEEHTMSIEEVTDSEQPSRLTRKSSHTSLREVLRGLRSSGLSMATPSKTQMIFLHIQRVSKARAVQLTGAAKRSPALGSQSRLSKKMKCAHKGQSPSQPRSSTH